MDLNQFEEVSLRMQAKLICRKGVAVNIQSKSKQQAPNNIKMEQHSQQTRSWRNRNCKLSTPPPSSVCALVLLLIYLIAQLSVLADLQVNKSQQEAAATGGEQTVPRVISRVSMNGKQMRRDDGDEEEGGFIMRTVTTTSQLAAGNESNTEGGGGSGEETTTIPQTILFPTTAAAPPAEVTTTPTSGGHEGDQSDPKSTTAADDSPDGRIAIDPSRQRYPTHDQLLNANTKDEPINVSAAVAAAGGQTSRAGMSRLAHASSFLSDILAPYFRPKPNQVVEQTDSVDEPAQATGSSANACPGVCLNILAASFRCRNALAAPCPSLLQKCCELDEATFNGTPVETSAPISNSDVDTNSVAPPSDATQVSRESSAERQAALQATQQPQQRRPQQVAQGGAAAQQQPPSGQQASVSADNRKQAEQQPAEQLKQVHLFAQQPVGSSVYFLSSSGDEPAAAATTSATAASPSQPLDGQQVRGGPASAAAAAEQQPAPNLLAQPTQAADAKFKLAASQSFDLLLTTTTAPPQLEKAANKVVVLQTANGTFVHQPGQQRRPIYANWTDYHNMLLAAHQQRPPQASQPVHVYHSNIDPVRKFAAPSGGGAAEKVQPENDLTQSGAKGAADADAELKVVRDEHSAASRQRASTTEAPATTSTTSTSSTTTTTTSTTSAPATSTESPESASVESSGGEQPSAVSGFASILGSIFDLMSAPSASSSQAAPDELDEAARGQPTATGEPTELALPPPPQRDEQQNDRRLGLDLSFRQPQQQLSEAPSAANKCLLGFCTLDKFVGLCDSFHAAPDCGANKKCCITSQTATRPAAGEVAAGGQPQLCRGTCLPVYQSTLCTKPNEVISSSPSCLASQVCCGQPVALTTVLDGNNYIEDSVDGSSQQSNLDQLLQTTVFPATQTRGGGGQLATAADGTLVASLVPQPPPQLHNVAGGHSTAAGDSLGEQTSRQRHAQANQLDHQQFLGATSRPPPPFGGSSAAAQNGGFVNQLLQMFRSNTGLGKARNKPQPQQPQQPFGAPQLIAAASLGQPVVAQPIYELHQHNQMFQQLPAGNQNQQLGGGGGQSQIMFPLAQANQQQFYPQNLQRPAVYSNAQEQQQVAAAHWFADAALLQKQINAQQAAVATRQQQVSQAPLVANQIHPFSASEQQLALPSNQVSFPVQQPQQQYMQPNHSHNKNQVFVAAQQPPPRNQIHTGQLPAGKFVQRTQNKWTHLEPTQEANKAATYRPSQSAQPERPFQQPAASRPAQQQQQQLAYPIGAKKQLAPVASDTSSSLAGFQTVRKTSPNVAQPQPQATRQQQQSWQASGSDLSAGSGFGSHLQPTGDELHLSDANVVSMAEVSRAPHVVSAATEQRQPPRPGALASSSAPPHVRPASGPLPAQPQPAATGLSPSSSNLNVRISNGPGANNLDGASQLRRPVSQVTQPPQPPSTQPPPAATPSGDDTIVSEADDEEPSGGATTEPVAAIVVDKSEDAAKGQDLSSTTASSNTLDLVSEEQVQVQQQVQQQQDKVARPKVQATACGKPGPPTRPGRTTSGKARGRVMGGRDAEPGHWCWQAALMNNKNEYLCGGALIGTKWVLTAAHCVTQHMQSEPQLFVRLGQWNLNSTSSAERQSARSVLVKTIWVHHNHNRITLDNDIALLKLDDSLGLLEDPAICTVCLPDRNSQLETGKRCTVTGYGFESESGPAALRVRQTDVPIVADGECQNKTSAVLARPFALPASSFCAGGELGQDACHGDGGSPLSCLVDGYYELTGIVSWGYKCGNKDLPGLYAKVSNFVGWINQVVSGN